MSGSAKSSKKASREGSSSAQAPLAPSQDDAELGAAASGSFTHQRRPTTAELEQEVFVDDREVIVAGLKNVAKVGMKGVEELRHFNLLKKDNRTHVKDNFNAGRKLLMKITADPQIEADKMGIEIDESK